MKVPACPFGFKRLLRDVNILLISDLHYDIVNEADTGISGLAINDKLLQNIVEQGPEWEPDIVIVAGDLVNRNIEINYPHYYDLVQKLTSRFPNLRHTFFSTPGNHDVTRENKEDGLKDLAILNGAELPNVGEEKLGKKEKKEKRALMRTALAKISKLRFTGAVSDTVFHFEQIYFQRYLSKRTELQSSPAGNTILAPVELTFAMDRFETVYLKSVLGLTLVGHNSSFFCNIGDEDEDRNSLYLMKELVETIQRKINTNDPVISFMHHPFYILNDSEHIGPAKNVDKEDINNNFTKIIDHSDLILCGHVHGILHDPTFLLGKAYLLTNGTSFTTENYIRKFHPYTFGLVKVNKQLRKFSLKKFKYCTVGEDEVTTDGFYPDIHEKRPFYEFVYRGGEPTTIESEKVRILHYFSGLSEHQHADQLYHFFVWQLSLYHDTFRLPGTQDYAIELAQDTNAAKQLVFIEGPDGKKICIYLMDSPDYLEQIRKIIEKPQSSLNAPGIEIFFSVNQQFLVDDEGAPSAKRIEVLRGFYRSLVLLSKKDYVSINVLYHKTPDVDGTDRQIL